jgi:hypothetical protein
MRIALLCGAALLAALLPVTAQEGHPLTGTWHGNWGPNATDRTDVTFVMEWDGDNISGIINPGFDVMRIQNARLEHPGWKVHLETDAKDAAGKTVHVVIDGVIENVTYARRQIVGTWTQGGRSNDFKLVRDN